jgi:hypothetical protein
LLQLSSADIDPTLLPGVKDLSQLLTDAREVFGDDFVPPFSDAQIEMLMKEKDIFTAGEDNLVRRGVVSDTCVDESYRGTWHISLIRRVLPRPLLISQRRTPLAKNSGTRFLIGFCQKGRNAPFLTGTPNYVFSCTKLME